MFMLYTNAFLFACNPYKPNLLFEVNEIIRINRVPEGAISSLGRYEELVSRLQMTILRTISDGLCLESSDFWVN